MRAVDYPEVFRNLTTWNNRKITTPPGKMISQNLRGVTSRKTNQGTTQTSLLSFLKNIYVSFFAF
jgi:hypothetical protein